MQGSAWLSITYRRLVNIVSAFGGEPTHNAEFPRPTEITISERCEACMKRICDLQLRDPALSSFTIHSSLYAT